MDSQKPRGGAVLHSVLDGWCTAKCKTADLSSFRSTVAKASIQTAAGAPDGFVKKPPGALHSEVVQDLSLKVWCWLGLWCLVFTYLVIVVIARKPVLNNLLDDADERGDEGVEGHRVRLCHLVQDAKRRRHYRRVPEVVGAFESERTRTDPGNESFRVRTDPGNEFLDPRPPYGEFRHVSAFGEFRHVSAFFG